jgi:hypothetical protein
MLKLGSKQRYLCEKFDRLLVLIRVPSKVSAMSGRIPYLLQNGTLLCGSPLLAEFLNFLIIGQWVVLAINILLWYVQRVFLQISEKLVASVRLLLHFCFAIIKENTRPISHENVQLFAR